MNTLTWGKFFIPDYDDRSIMFNGEITATESKDIVRCRTAKQTKELCEFLNQAIAGQIDFKKVGKYL